MNGDSFPLMITENYSVTGTVIDDILISLKENIARFFSVPKYEPEQDVASNGIIELKTCSAISDETFSKELTASQIRKLKALKAAAGILNDFTAEQMKVFEENVKRRPLFK